MGSIRIFLICLIVFQAGVYAQDNTNIVSDFDSLVKSSNNYQQYKVIKKASLNAFRKDLTSTSDSLTSKILNLEDKIKNFEVETKDLSKQIKDTNAELDTLKAAKDEISLLGLNMTKSSYTILVWSIILVLIVILLFLLAKYRNRNSITQELKENLKNTNTEFEQYRHRAIEKQQKLGRELLDAQKKVQEKNRKNQ